MVWGLCMDLCLPIFNQSKGYMLGQAIPKKMRATMAIDPSMQVCMRNELLHDHVCAPDPLNPRKMYEWEHALMYAGRKINAPWAIISICWLVHRGGKLNKEINVWIALNRATDEELRAISKAVPYLNIRERLNSIYGVPKKIINNQPEMANINYEKEIP